MHWRVWTWDLHKKNTGQYAILCNNFNHAYHDQDNAHKESLSSNDIFHILTKEVMKHLIYPSRKSAIAQQYRPYPNYPQTSLNVLLDFIKKDISILEGKKFEFKSTRSFSTWNKAIMRIEWTIKHINSEFK